MLLQTRRAVVILVSLSILCGLVYPLIMTALAQILMPHQANGSPLTVGDRVAGSGLIGQMFENPKYFHGRPSATEPAYNGEGSAGSNLGPSSARLRETVAERIAKVRRENGLDPQAPIPADLVLASASGLDPHISPEAAALQVSRVARLRRLAVTDVEALVNRCTEKPLLGVWGRARVNVLKLNAALDGLEGKATP